MKYLKMLGFAAIAAMAVMAFASTASATVLTRAVNEEMKVGETIDASASSSLTLKAGFANVTCTGSTVKGSIGNAGDATHTVSGAIEEIAKENVPGLTFTNCGSFIVKVIHGGSLEVHTEGGTNNGNGLLTSTGAEVTTALGTTSCVYGTPTAKSIGTLKGSSNNGGGTATFTIATELTRISGGILCANPAKWEGTYKVTTPDYLDVH